MIRARAETLFAAHRHHLWSLAYRMLGSAVEAEDVVQETFVRLLTRPPADTTSPLRPWLVRVTMNLGRDQLRRRKRRPYTGPWLPSPVETSRLETIDLIGSEHGEGMRADPECRYGQLESATMAFLLALEALSPSQRAVLLLRDVLDYSVKETAHLLEMTETNVKVSLHRARGVMEGYDADRHPPTREQQQRTLSVLQRMLESMGADDAHTLRNLLRTDAVALNDGGGEFLASLKPVYGPDRIARFFLSVKPDQVVHDAVVSHNGFPALVAEWKPQRPRTAPRGVLQILADDAGSITGVLSILASPKLQAVCWRP